MWLDVLTSFIVLSVELTVLFLVVSFIVNLLQGFIPYERLKTYLFNSNYLAGLAAAVFLAFITPFCSCSTIPIVVNMLQQKMRFGLVLTFLFASPVLDPTILTLMAVMLGWKVAAVYTAVTGILSVLIGFALERLGFAREVKTAVLLGFLHQPKETGKLQLKDAWQGTIRLMRTVYPYLLAGAAIGSFINGVVPTEWITAYFGGKQWWLIPAAAVLGIPLYIRLSTMIPISQIMIAKGMALGPVMALVISSAGASLPEVTLLHSIFRKKLVFAFVLSVVAMATMAGTIFYIV